MVRPLKHHTLMWYPTVGLVWRQHRSDQYPYYWGYQRLFIFTLFSILHYGFWIYSEIELPGLALIFPLLCFLAHQANNNVGLFIYSSILLIELSSLYVYAWVPRKIRINPFVTASSRMGQPRWENCKKNRYQWVENNSQWSGLFNSVNVSQCVSILNLPFATSSSSANLNICFWTRVFYSIK